MAAVLLASGCSTATAQPIAATVDFSALEERRAAAVTTVPEDKMSGTILLIEEEEVVEEPWTPPEDSEYLVYTSEDADYPLSLEYQEFFSKCVFVGDSICSGLKNWGILPPENVYAQGNVGVRNVFDDWVTYEFNGKETCVADILKELQPEYIVCWMGMNDVNFFGADTYIEKYDEFITTVHEVTPYSKFIVLSTTPVAYREDGKIFTYNTDIDAFNEALKDYCIKERKATYVDVAHPFREWDGTLKQEYLGTADGVHLNKSAYIPMLYAFGQRAVDGKEWQSDGTFIDVAPILK